MKSILRTFALIAFLAISLSSAAQGREYIRNAISGWGECRNVAITRTNGDLAIYQSNGTARSSCPSELNNKLIELNKNHNYIDDVCLTENGNWIILYDDNCFWWNGIPRSMENKLRQYNSAGETVTSVTFNDRGEWIIVTTKHIAANSTSTQDWLAEGCDEYGMLWTVSMTDNGIVAVYENGYQFRGDVPTEFKNALREADFDVYRAKWAGTSWFMADRDGTYQYNM